MGEGKNRPSSRAAEIEQFDREFAEYIEQAKLRENPRQAFAALELDESEVHRRARIINEGPCAKCGRHKRVNAFETERVGGFLVFYIKNKRTLICCASCARIQQKRDLRVSLFVGIWGIGIFPTIVVTFRFIYKNPLEENMSTPNILLKEIVKQSMIDEIIGGYSEKYFVNII